MRALSVLVLMSLGAGLAAAQAPPTLTAGTHVDARLQSRISARQAHVGDQVTAVTTAAVEDHGRMVLPRGAQLTGHVTSVTAADTAQSPSRVGILFDRATAAGGQTVPVHLAIAGVTQAALLPPGAPEAMPMPAMPPPLPAAAGAGGALGVTGAVLSPVAGATAGLGAATAAAAPLPPLPAQPAIAVLPLPTAGMGASGSVAAGSILSVPHGNLLLASGTRLQLVAAGGGGQ